MAYGLLGLKQHMEGNSLNALRKTAQIQEKNKIANENLKEAKRARKMSSIASGAGMGFAVGGPMGAVIGGLAGAIF